MSLKTKRNRKKRIDNGVLPESEVFAPMPRVKAPLKQPTPTTVLTESDVLVNRLYNAVSSTSRRIEELFGVTHSGKRDTGKVFGYPEAEERNFALYWQYYKYQDVCGRIIDMLPKSCWRDGAIIKDTGDETILEDEVKQLKRLGLFRALERADILNRIGSYSMLYIGIPDNKLPSEPLEKVGRLNPGDIFFSEYAEPAIQISSTEQNKKSPRYGLPVMYTLTPSGNPTTGGYGEAEQRAPIKVHYTRVVRLAENALGNPLFGRSTLENILNRMIDLQKTLGGSAESYFANAMQKLLMNIKPDADSDTIDMDELQALAEKFTNNMMNFLAADGVDMKTVGVAHADPRGTVEMLQEFLSSATGYPIRILFGKGPGDRAGFQDKASYNTLVGDRQDSPCAGWLEQVFEILNLAGYFELPDGWYIDWPPMEAMDDLTISEVQKNRADAASAMITAISQFQMGGLDNILNLTELLEKVASLEIETKALPAFEPEPLDSEPTEGDDPSNGDE